MSKAPKQDKPQSLVKPSSSQTPSQGDFDVVLALIEAARTRAVAAVNTTLIDLYWSVGEFISLKISEDGWGKGTVESLAETIQRRYPGMTGYSARIFGECGSFTRLITTRQNSHHWCENCPGPTIC